MVEFKCTWAVFTCFRAGFALCLLLLAPLAAAVGQVEVRSRAVQITLTGRVHSQFNTSSVSDEPAAEFLVRRARFTADVKVDDFVSGRIQPDYGEGTISLKDAYVRLTFHPAFRTTIGQFKRPFDLFELTSSTEILVIERAGAIRGLDACTGPGGTCSFSRVTEKLQFSDRDIGVMLDGSDPTGTFRYMVAVTNGTGSNTSDENGSKSYSGRIEVTPVRDVTITANAAAHDYLLPVAPDLAENEYAMAFGGDLELGNYDRGLHVQAGVATGDNWLNLVSGVPTTFLTTQGIVTWKAALRPNRFASAVEPLVRVSWADPDTDVADDEGILATGGLVLHFVGRNKLAVNVDVWSPAVGDSELSLKFQSYLHF